MSESTAKAVFLSYASQDAEAARRLCESLRSGGVEVWFDQEGGLEHGDEWDQKIRRQIKECVLFIPLVSANTQARHEGYFRIEWDLAAERARGIASGVPFILPVVIDDTREADALVPDRFRMVQWTKLRRGEVPPDVQQRFLKLWSHRTGVLKHEATQASAPAVHTAPSAAESIGNPNAKNYALIAAAIAVIVVGTGWWLLGGRSKPAAPIAAPVASRAAPAAEFPRDPDLKRVYKLLYNVVDGIAEDFALMDDLVKPLLTARPNDPEVVTVAAELAQEFVTRGFDASPARRAQAQKLTERAVQLAPDNPEALATLGFYLYSTRTQLVRAEELLRRAIELNPKEPRFYCFLYHVLTASNKPAAEIDAFGVRMAALFPDYAMAPYVIAGHYTDISNFAAAEEWFDKSLAIAPVPSAITSKAQIMLEVHGDVEGMKRWLERMPDRQRTNAGMANTYAVLATVTGQTGAARRLLESIGDTWLADGSYTFPKALLVGELEQLDGHDDIARLQFEAAQKEVQARLAADPTDLRPMRAEMWVQIGLGHRDEARAALRINLQRRPTPYHWTLNLTWWTGALRACLLLDERAQAITLLNEACVEPTGRLLLRNLFRVDPMMAPFRDDPDIVALLAEPKKETAALPVAAVDAKSVAVLAFANLSEDKANEYFSDGISEELLNVLAKISGLTVRGRSSGFYFKGKQVKSAEIGQQLNVSYLVQGSVRRAGDRVRISAQLIRAATDDVVWSSGSLDRDLKDIFAVQDEIAGLIAKNLSLKMGVVARAPHQVNPEALTALLEGRSFWALRTPEGFARAGELFNRAVALDPDWAPAHAALASLLAIEASYLKGGGESMSERFALAAREAKRAIELDPTLGEPHAALGKIAMEDRRFAEAEEESSRALVLEPNNALVVDWHGDLMVTRGRLDAAIAAYRRAMELEPLSPYILWDLAWELIHVRRYGEALPLIERAATLTPTGSARLSLRRARLLLELGRKAEAEVALRVYLESPRTGSDPQIANEAVWCLQTLGSLTDRERWTAELLRQYPDIFSSGVILLMLGREVEAYPLLEKIPTIFWQQLYWDPVFDRVRDTPRFHQLLEKLGCAAEYKVARETLARLLKEQAAKK